KEIQRRVAAAPSDVTNHGGPVLANVQCTTVFLGDAWSQAPFSSLRDAFNTFLDDYLASSEFTNLSVYGIGTGSRIGTLTTTDALGSTVLDSDLQAIVTRLTASGGQIVPNANTLLFLFTPQGTIVDATAIGAGQTCTDHCGYHNFVGNVPYAIMPYLECSGCLGSGLTTEQSMTSVMSHELCEAVTDPMLNGWYSSTGEEIGDLCAWQETSVDGYTAQKEWINGQGCI
ncbi:MAG: hypothetical protein JO060_02475, partial [Candidatus Eremiobacteraeota bacterium]|nr:hypothetical protein [Candidatus Eremiobacteraeota bacterium]